MEMKGTYTVYDELDSKGVCRIITDSWKSVFSDKPTNEVKEFVGLLKRMKRPEKIEHDSERIRKGKPKDGYDFVKIKERCFLSAYYKPTGGMIVSYLFGKSHEYHIVKNGVDYCGTLDYAQKMALMNEKR